MPIPIPAPLASLLHNSRFWILSAGIITSFTIAGSIQLVTSEGITQVVRIQEAAGFIAVGLLYGAVVISPVYAVFPRLPYKDAVVHARRAIGVLAFYYALIHSSLAFFGQLQGFGGIDHYDSTYSASILLGFVALIVLTLLAATSFDAIVRRMGRAHWKLLHRLIYIAGAAVLVHVILIGTHFIRVSGLGIALYAAAGAIVVLEAVRIIRIRMAIRRTA